jgi:predicted HNH restriction endonuclease
MTSNWSDLEMEFNIGRYNGSMRMQILVNDNPVAEYFNIESDNLVFKHQIPWPCNLKILISDKNLSIDTQVDDQGNITADKFIQLKKILVDRMNATEEFIRSTILDTGENKIKSYYWGFNGTVNIDFDHADSLAWHLKQRISSEETYVVTGAKI